MIEYIANFYEAEKRPVICKKFTSTNGEDSHTAINVGNEVERQDIAAEVIYEHMGNVLKYLDAKLDTMSIVQLDELNNPEPWPIKGWSEVEWCQNEVVLWWNFIYYKDYKERLEAKFQEEYQASVDALIAAGAVEGLAHTHGSSSDHTHDETGAEVPVESSSEPESETETPA
jgi:hypothetical protein